VAVIATAAKLELHMTSGRLRVSINILGNNCTTAAAQNATSISTDETLRRKYELTI
jgi:hypothetical protein